MLRHVALVCLVVAVSAKQVEKRQINQGYGAPAAAAAPAQSYGGPGGAAPAPALDTSFNSVGGGFGGAVGGGFGGAVGGGSGGKCRDETKYILTWTKAVIPVTVYDTRTEFLPTTLYKYVTETEYYPQTVVQLETTTRAGGSEYQEETKIAYRTNTVVVPQVETVTSTLVFTEDEHETVTETDTFTQTQAQQYPVEVTVTSTQRIPQVSGGGHTGSSPVGTGRAAWNHPHFFSLLHLFTGTIVGVLFIAPLPGSLYPHKFSNIFEC